MADLEVVSQWSGRRRVGVVGASVESFAKKPSTALSQEQEVGTKWKVLASAAGQARFLGIVVHMDALVASMRVEEADELRWRCMQRPMTLPSSTLRAANRVVVPFVAKTALFHRQAGLGAVERLDLRLFVDREHDGVGRRVDVEPATSRSWRRSRDRSKA